MMIPLTSFGGRLGGILGGLTRVAVGGFFGAVIGGSIPIRVLYESQKTNETRTDELNSLQKGNLPAYFHQRLNPQYQPHG